jgi:uncharacterized protein
MTFKIKHLRKINKNFNQAVLIIGLPGIANAGKIAIDYLLSELETEEIAEFISDKGPYFTIVTEDNLVTMPKIILSHKKINKQDFFFISGDYQPFDEPESDELQKKINNLIEEFKIKKIFALGGIGLEDEPENPKVYAAANNHKFLNELKKLKVNIDSGSRIATIVGISGLLIAKTKVDAVALLAETSAFPGHAGLKPAKELLKTIKKIFNLNLNFKDLNKDLKEIQKITENLFSQIQAQHKKTDVNYIG